MNDTTPNTPTTPNTGDAPARGGVRVPDGALWASALVIAALILVQAGRVADTPARAEMASKSGAYSMITTKAGGAEALFVVDDRTETLMIFEVRPGQKFELRRTEGLPELFERARGRAVPTP